MKISTIGLVLILLAGDLKADQIAFFFALDADFQSFKQVAKESAQPVPAGGKSIQRLKIGNHSVYALKMGVGCVETTLSAQALLTKFPCDWVYSVGPVGALNNSLKIGQWTEVRQVTAYQRGSDSPAGFMLSPASMFDLPRYETAFPKTSLPPIFAQAQPVHVASGETFSNSGSFREKIASATKAAAIDMNLFGLASVCQANAVPLFAWRIVSDHSDGQASRDYQEFIKNYKGEGGLSIAKLIENLPPNPNHADSYPELRKLMEP